ncbi:MAG: RIP metalloprotease RseP [Parcubacteria group bacterium CG08_land_8_20_14_0_20_38_56]|nr:MAG: RIP metalloprotease RseP [Parcubacteria group bacterium CG08_land_8_20_14_0_20_38_56]
MVSTIFTLALVVFAIGLLIFLHELGHFVLAKREGVKVEEFGFGYPPRIFGKKIGQTLYSINWIPFGGFVKIFGEQREEGEPKPGSFYSKSIWARVKIVLGGVVMFWVIAFLVLCSLHIIGVPTAIGDEDDFVNARVQILQVASGSPADIAGFKAGDTIKKFSIFNFQFSIDKVEQLQNLTKEYAGQEVILEIQRGAEVLEISIIPRKNPPAGEGAMGIALSRVAVIKYPWYKAIWQGAIQTFNLTLAYVVSLAKIIGQLFSTGKAAGVQLMGPVGMGHMSFQMARLGISYFLNFIVIISIALAVCNLLPLPAIDGGKLLFLIVEKVKGSPVNIKFENAVNSVGFILLITLMLFITYKDILRLF